MILITGASGNVGLSLVHQLEDIGAPLRIVTRDRQRLPRLPQSVEVCVGEISDRLFVREVMQGVDRLFLFPVVFDQAHATTKLLVDEAKAAGVKHIVMLSTRSCSTADSEIGRLHREKELLVEQSGIDWTFLRPTAFMSNVWQWMPTIRSQGKVFSATGEGKIAPIGQVDIAAVAVEALTGKGHAGKIYELTGPELLSAREQVNEIAQTIGRPIQYIEVPAETLSHEMSKNGAPAFLVAGMISNWRRIKDGKTADQTFDLESVTGSSGQTFDLWCLQHRAQLKELSTEKAGVKG